MKNVWVMDCGKNGVTLLNSETNKISRFAGSQIVDKISQLPRGSLLIGENAHFGVPKNRKSLAQYFTADELQELYQACCDNGINFRLFPEVKTPEARRVLGYEKSTDENDCKAIAHWVTKVKPQLMSNLKRPPTPTKKKPDPFEFTQSRKYGHKFTDETNAIINVGRNQDYYHPDNKLSVWLLENCHKIMSRLSPDARAAINPDNKLLIVSRGPRKGILHKNSATGMMYSMAAVFMDEMGTIRYREDTGELPKWNFIKRYVIRASPHHLKGGLLRSQIYFHYGQSFIQKEMYKTYGRTSKKQDRYNRSKHDMSHNERADVTKHLNNYVLQHSRELFRVIRELILETC